MPSGLMNKDKTIWLKFYVTPIGPKFGMGMPNPNKPRTATDMLKMMMTMGAKTVKFNFLSNDVTIQFSMYDIDHK